MFLGKNRIHAVLASYNRVSPVVDLFGEQGRSYLAETLEALRTAAQRVVMDNLQVVDHLTRQTEALEADIQLSENQQRIIKILKTMHAEKIHSHSPHHPPQHRFPDRDSVLPTAAIKHWQALLTAGWLNAHHPAR